jgi:hypothetical protein
VLELVEIVVDAEAHLVQVVGALGACGRLAGLLHRGDEQADQDGDDGDHHQQLDQREAPAPRAGASSLLRHVGILL